MSSRCPPTERRPGVPALLVALLAAAGALAGCDREEREYREDSARTGAPKLPLASAALQPGAGAGYEGNAFHVTQGGRLYKWFNCSGCHGAGGGNMGPALMDSQWRYGGSIEQIHATILEGRPNGMPAFRGRIPDQQAWQLAAYVRSLSGNVPMSAAPSRKEGMKGTPPLTQVPEQPPLLSDPSATQVPAK